MGGVAAEERTQLVVVGDRGQRSEIEIIVDLDQSIDHPFAEGALHVGYERHVCIVRIQGGSRAIPKRQANVLGVIGYYDTGCAIACYAHIAFTPLGWFLHQARPPQTPALPLPFFPRAVTCLWPGRYP